MQCKSRIQLSRELRFALHDSSQPTPPGATNSFAAEPALLDITPFLTLAATLSGEIDPATGMLINIKQVDKLLRQQAIPILRDGYFREPPHPAPALLHRVFQGVRPLFAPHTLESLSLALSPYVRLAIYNPEVHMVHLSLRFEFSAAHRLHSHSLSAAENQEVFGRCNNPSGHGHNYELEVTVAGAPDGTGHLMPIHQLQKIVNANVIDPFDHKHLNVDCAEFDVARGGVNPTVENIAGVIFAKLKPQIPAPARLQRIRLWETPKTFAECSD